MQNKIPVIFFSDNEQTKNVLKLYISELEDFEYQDNFALSDEICSSISNIEKSVLIIDITADTDKKLNLINKITNSVSNTKVIVLADLPKVDLIVKSIRAGAKEFLALPLIKRELFDALEKSKEALYCVAKPLSKCKIITIFSNKGGIGKTAVASNLALELAKITKENVALLDLNFQLGDITTFLDIKPAFNISYLLQNLDKINQEFLQNTMERYKQSSLYVLADPPYLKQAENISSKQLVKLLNILKNTFSYIVIDAESSFEDKNIAALSESDMICLITVANLPVLRNTQRCLDLFDKMGINNSKIQVLLNRYMENDEVSADDVEKVINRKVYWKIPNNYFTMMSSINKGIPVTVMSPESNVAKSYHDLALLITDKLYKASVTEKYDRVLR